MNTSQLKGGSNYISHDLLNSVVTRYHLDTDVINAQLDQMVAAGQRSLGLPLLMYENSPGGVFVDWAGGHFTPQNASNFAALVKRARSAGFDFALVAPQFYAGHDLRQAAFAEKWDVLFGDCARFYFESVRPALAGTIPYVLDLCTEGIGDARGSCQRYCQTLWTMWTAYWWPGGVPCFDATISFVPTEANVQAAPAIFAGLGGPVNWPAFLNPHAYAQNGSMDVLTSIRTWLDAVGAPVRPWLIGETYTLSDADVQLAAETRKFVCESQQPIMSVIQWPVSPATPEGEVLAVAATVWKGWPDNGF